MFSKFRLCKQQLQFYCIQCQDFHFSFWLEIFFWERGGEKEKIYGDILDLVFVIFLRWEKSQMFLKAHFWLFNGYAMFLQKVIFLHFSLDVKKIKKDCCVISSIKSLLFCALFYETLQFVETLKIFNISSAVAPPT